MTSKEKLLLLEDVLELEEGYLKEDMELADIENWDSMTKLSLIVMLDDEFGKKISGEQIRKFVTIRDIMDVME